MKLRNQPRDDHLSTHSIAKITKKTRQPLTVNRRRKINFFSQKALEMENLIGSPRSENWTRLLVAFIDYPKIDEEAVNSWLDREPTLTDNAFLGRRCQRNSPRLFKPDDYPISWRHHFDEIIINSRTAAMVATNLIGSHSQDAPPTTLELEICNVAETKMPGLVEPKEKDFTASPQVSPTVGHQEKRSSSTNVENSESREDARTDSLKLIIPYSMCGPNFRPLGFAAPEPALSPPLSLPVLCDPKIEAETNSYSKIINSHPMSIVNDVSYSAESKQSSSQNLVDNGAEDQGVGDGTGEENVKTVPVGDGHEVKLAISSQHETKGIQESIPPYQTMSPIKLEEPEKERKAIVTDFSSLDMKPYAPLTDLSINSIPCSSPRSSMNAYVKSEPCSYYGPPIASYAASSSGSSEIDVGIQDSPRTAMAYPIIVPIDFNRTISNWTTDEERRGNSGGLGSFADLRFSPQHNPVAFDLILRIQDRLYEVNSFVLQLASILMANR